MLKLYYKLKDMDFAKLMALYADGNRENAEDQFPDDDINVGILRVEQDFYQYLNQVFFSTKGAFYAVWEENNIYLSALRMEPYQDGMLLEALETHPEYRKLGCARKLIDAVLASLKQNGALTVYAHIHKKNHASLRTHLSCGFKRVMEHAVYIDGSVNSYCCTFQYTC